MKNKLKKCNWVFLGGAFVSLFLGLTTTPKFTILGISPVLWLSAGFVVICFYPLLLEE